MYKMIVCFLLLGLAGTRLHAQCALLANCPIGPDTICDPAYNSAQFWNESYWSDPLYNSHNLAEGSVELPLYVLDSCGMGNVSISFVLFLDLNNDGVRETAVSSDNLPPANTIYYGNAANPGYTGGTPRSFDERLVTAAQKYQFALARTVSDDTLIARVRWINTAPNPDTVNARLPAGTHRIEWRMQQGSVVKTCQYDFTVRDCWPPDVLCQTGFEIDINAAGLATVTLPALLTSVQDNYTPTAQIQRSLREADTGTGFPLDSVGNTVQQLSFDCTGLGIHLLEVWAKDKVGLTNRCQTFVVVVDTAFVCSPPPPVIAEVCVKNYCAGQGIEGVSFETQGGNPADAPHAVFSNGITPASGCLLMAIPTPPAANALFFARKNDNPLNGVSTYDLVLISRHLLGLQALGSPYKMIAADVNHSNSLTTFDIVELRKLILGIYQELPNNTSWRFVDAAFTFPNPDNAFQSTFPESITLPALAAGTAPADFYGIKVGDVNCNALGYTESSEDRFATILQVPDIELAAGTITDIPVRLATADSWLGAQGSLVFDPEKLAIEALRSEQLPGWSTDDWALLPGQVNWSWSAARPVVLLPDEEFLTLRVKALTTLRLRDVLTLGEENAAQNVPVLRPEAYGEDARLLGLQLQFGRPVQSSEGTQVFAPHPNPTIASVYIPLRLTQTEVVTLEIVDMTGRMIFRAVTSLEAGPQMLEVPATAFPQVGLYGWRVQVGQTVRTGKVVKN